MAGFAPGGLTAGGARARAGLAVVALVVVALVADGAVGFVAPQVLRGELVATGFPLNTGLAVSLSSLACALVYAVPRTRVLGAILITGFLGGAICTHLRLGEFGSPPQIASAALGGLAWLGPWLQDARVRALLPLARGA